MPIELKEPELAARTTQRLTSLPILLLNIHENCNCRCLMCDIWKRPRGSQLDVAALARHRESMRALGVQQVVLTGGEPLLHTDFDALCLFLRSCDVRITLLTTGLLLTKRAQSIASYIDEVIVSLDGSQAVHDAVRRVPRGFDLIRAGITVVRSLRPRMPIHARSTVQRANFRYLRETVAAAKTLGLDGISFLAADVSSQAFNRELVWPGERQNEIALARAEIADLEEEIEKLIVECREEIASHYIAESPAKLRRITRRFREHMGELLPQSPQCNAPWVSAVMEIDGSIRPCFFHRQVGDASAMTLDEAINSPQAQDFRRNLNVATNPTCQRCVCSLNYKNANTASSLSELLF
jgi:Fe-coproporphyrin III synthase